MKKKIFISGGSKGIGLAIAERFYGADYHVIITARGEAGLQEAREAMPEIDAIACDMSDKALVKALAKRLNEQYGPLDVVVNNAGVFKLGNLHDEPDEAFEEMMATNVHSAYYLTKGILPPMIAEKKGLIINVCSVASLKAYPGGGSYGLTKYALLGFSKGLREELKPMGIRVVSIMPGAVLTRSWEGVDVPAERLMPASDIAELVWCAAQLSERSVVEDIVVRPMLGDL